MISFLVRSSFPFRIAILFLPSFLVSSALTEDLISKVADIIQHFILITHTESCFRFVSVHCGGHGERSTHSSRSWVPILLLLAILSEQNTKISDFSDAASNPFVPYCMRKKQKPKTEKSKNQKPKTKKPKKPKTKNQKPSSNGIECTLHWILPKTQFAIIRRVVQKVPILQCGHFPKTRLQISPLWTLFLHYFFTTLRS